MMKQLFSILLSGCLLGVSSFAYAQKTPREIVRALLKTPAGTPISAELRQSLSQLSPKQLSTVTAQLQRANAKLAQSNKKTRQFQQDLFSSTRAAIFRALPTATGPRNSYTGTLFEVENNGKQEIFGVIPMHALKAPDQTAGLLSYKFTAVVDVDGAPQRIPARVVQLSSSKTADVALVKFEEKDSALLSPLKLAPNAPVTSGTRLYTQGYACNLPARALVTVTGTTSTGLLTTAIPAAHEGERLGFCGSALVNEAHELMGIHVGSMYVHDTQESTFFNAFQLEKPHIGDTGYMAPVSFLYQLTQSYLHPGKAVIPVQVRGQEITRLRVNEYISRIELLDEHHQTIWQKDTDIKMSLRPVEQALLLFPQTRWIRLHVGRTHWQKNENGWYVADDKSLYRVVVSGVPELE